MVVVHATVGGKNGYLDRDRERLYVSGIAVHFRLYFLATMPHADSSSVPASVTTKAELWKHILAQLENLLDGNRQWVR